MLDLKKPKKPTLNELEFHFVNIKTNSSLEEAVHEVLLSSVLRNDTVTSNFLYFWSVKTSHTLF